MRWGLLIDSNRCASGCTDCVTACNTENGLTGGTPNTKVQWIRKVEIKDLRTGKTQSLPMMCQHCAHPPCVDVCPTGASMKRADGIVLVDRHICIGCRYCAHVASNTFVVEQNWGRSRAIRQDGDSTALIQEAIDTCPVDCIHWVPYEALPDLGAQLAQQEIQPLGLPQQGRIKRTLPRSS